MSAAEVDPSLIQCQNTITELEELVVQFNGVVDTYSNVLIELAHRPMSIVKCARVVDEADSLMHDAHFEFLRFIETSREMCGTVSHLLPTHINSLGNDSTEDRAQRTDFLIAIIDEASYGINPRLSHLQKYLKEIKKVIRRVSALKVYIHGPVGTILLESVAAGVIDKKLVPVIIKKFGEVQSLLQELKTTLTPDTNDELTSAAGGVAETEK